METTLTCMICFQAEVDAGASMEDVSRGVATYRVPILSRGISEWRCPKNHLVAFWVQTPFYGKLFMKGLEELAEHDTRSAVLDLYSAWDNFVSYTSAALLNTWGITSEAVPGALRRAEPMMGLFAGVVASKTGTLPELVPADVAAIRNKVIHSDHIPSEDEAIKVGRAVQRAILSTLVPLEKILSEYERGPHALAPITAAYRERYAGKPPVPLTTVYEGLDLEGDLGEKLRDRRRRLGDAE